MKVALTESEIDDISVALLEFQLDRGIFLEHFNTIRLALENGETVTLEKRNGG